MDTTHASLSTKLKVGTFTLLGLIAIIVITLTVSGQSYWWKSCQLVKINVDDANGLKSKAPIRSLGIEIGYLKSAVLTETHVTLGICITAPIEVLPSTRAYIRAEGFLGDKFVELKPVKYIGPVPSTDKSSGLLHRIHQALIPSVWAAEKAEAAESEAPAPSTRQKNAAGQSKEIPVGEQTQDIQHIVNRVDDLVDQMSGLTDNLRKAINPDELRSTMRQINQTLQNASKTLAPEGGLTQTAQRSLAKLEDAIEQLRDMMVRINKGEGSVGMLLNDPSYAAEIKQAIKNVNYLLNKVAEVRFNVDIGATQITAYNGGRGWFQVGIWPKPDRYYLLGIAMDPRGRIIRTSTVTTAGGVTIPTETQTLEQTSILLTAMLGKVYFSRLDLSVGALYSDGTASVALRLGPTGEEDRIVVRNDMYVRSSGTSLDARTTLTLRAFSGLYLRAGIESFRTYGNTNQLPFILGAGISFDDEDIKLLFALK